MSLFYFQIVSNSASVTNYIFDERKSPIICIVTVVRSELTDFTPSKPTHLAQLTRSDGSFFLLNASIDLI